jgi:glycosyltransferase involved in cell wall biosynthesis
MRLAMLTTRATVDGPLPKLTPLLADALRRQGCEVELLQCWGRRVEGERLPAKLWGRTADVRAATKEIVRGGFPLVVVHTSHDWNTLARDLVLMRTLPRGTVRVLQFHGTQSRRLVGSGSRAFKWATAELVSRANGVLLLSREEEAEWQRFRPATRLFVVRNPMPPLVGADTISRPGHDGSPIILSVARLIPGKGGAELIRALPRVRAETACRLWLVGSGPERSRLRELAVELGVDDSVELRGYLEGSALTNAYMQATVFALPTSLQEGFPLSILEAMAAGLPVVTTPSRGPADHLIEGRNALLVPAGDSAGLAAALLRLLRDANLSREMGAANREKVHDFDPDVVARDYLAALEEIVAASQGRARLE